MHFTTYMPGPHTNVGMAGAHTDRRKSSKIAPLAAAAEIGRARGGHISSRIAEIPGGKRRLRRVFEFRQDLRGSLIVSPAVKSSCAGFRYWRGRAWAAKPSDNLAL
jgi:hypothetical protein